MVGGVTRHGLGPSIPAWWRHVRVGIGHALTHESRGWGEVGHRHVELVRSRTWGLKVTWNNKVRIDGPWPGQWEPVRHQYHCPCIFP